MEKEVLNVAKLDGEWKGGWRTSVRRNGQEMRERGNGGGMISGRKVNEKGRAHRACEFLRQVAFRIVLAKPLIWPGVMANRVRVPCPRKLD